MKRKLVRDSLVLGSGLGLVVYISWVQLDWRSASLGAAHSAYVIAMSCLLGLVVYLLYCRSNKWVYVTSFLVGALMGALVAVLIPLAWEIRNGGPLGDMWGLVYVIYPFFGFLMGAFEGVLLAARARRHAASLAWHA